VFGLSFGTLVELAMEALGSARFYMVVRRLIYRGLSVSPGVVRIQSFSIYAVI